MFPSQEQMHPVPQPTPPFVSGRRRTRPIFRFSAIFLSFTLVLGTAPKTALGVHSANAMGATPDVVLTPVLPPMQRMRVPVAEPHEVSRLFDRPDRDWSAGHRGVDFTVAAGDAVYATAGGEVTFVGVVVNRHVLVVLHDNGLRSSFEPVISGLATGDRVSVGDRIGEVATPNDGLGHCGAQCVHWGVRMGDFYLDPLTLVATEPSVLLPDRP